MKRILLIIASIFTICTAMNASTPQQQIDSIMQQRYGTDAPGGGIMILKGDSVIFENYYGIADMTTGEPICEKTRFNIASISKQFTVVGALRLVDEGKLALDTPIAPYFPQYKASFWNDIKLWHLMSHTSGLPDTRDRSNRNACVYANDAISMSYFPNVTALRFTPGEYYDYKNPTFILIANIIEQLEGKQFIDYQQQHIFNPLGMLSTSYFNPDYTPANTAHGYINTQAEASASTDSDTAGKTIEIKDNKSIWQEYDYGEETFFATRPDGGIYSTIRDLRLWEKALKEHRIISKEMLSAAYTPHITVTGSSWSTYQNRPNTSYGLGWFIDNTPGYPTKVYHTGDNGGFQAYLGKFPQKDVTVIILENRNDNDRWSLVKTIDKILLNAGIL